MVKRWQTGLRRWAALSALGLGSAFLGGCSSAQHAQVSPPDPLRGEMVPPGMPQPTSGQKADSGNVPIQPQAGKAGVPVTPVSMSSSNTAALAGTSWQGRPNANSFEDNSSGPPFLPGQSTLGSKTPQVVAPNANPKVEEIPDARPASPLSVAPTGSWQTDSPAVKTAQLVNAELLSRQLEDRGVLNQKQDAVPEGVHLTCYLSRGPQGGLRILEVTAADYPAAAQAILQQLDSAR